MSVGEVFTVVSVLQVVNVLVRAEVVHVVDVVFTDSRLNLVKIILHYMYFLLFTPSFDRTFFGDLCFKKFLEIERCDTKSC